METINVLFHKVPFVRLTVFFALGCMAIVKGVSFKFVYVSLISGVLFLLLHVLIDKQKDESRYTYRWLFGLSVSAFMFAFGMFFSHQTRGVSQEYESRYYVGRVIEAVPSYTSRAVQCTVALSEVDESRMQKDNQSFDAVVYIPKSKSSEKIAVGDSLLIAPKTPVVKERNEELELENLETNIFFVQDDAWTLISKSNSLHVETIKDSLISMLKKKDVQMLN